jgi:hypothetical protein
MGTPRMYRASVTGYRTAGVLLINRNGALLMQHRDEHARISPDKWGVPGGRTDAVDHDIVLGEGRWIGFIAPEHALDRELSASAALMVPMFLSSDTYVDLRSQVLS